MFTGIHGMIYPPELFVYTSRKIPGVCCSNPSDRSRRLEALADSQLSARKLDVKFGIFDAGNAQCFACILRQLAVLKAPCDNLASHPL